MSSAPNEVGFRCDKVNTIGWRRFGIRWGMRYFSRYNCVTCVQSMSDKYGSHITWNFLICAWLYIFISECLLLNAIHMNKSCKEQCYHSHNRWAHLVMAAFGWCRQDEGFLLWSVEMRVGKVELRVILLYYYKGSNIIYLWMRTVGTILPSVT